MGAMELFSQAGMEVSERAFLRRCHEDMPGTMCQMLPLEFVDCDFEEKTLTVAATPASWMANPRGVMHGGAAAALLDETMGSLTFYCSGEFITPTISLQCSYLRPVSLDRRVLIRARCSSSGRTLAYATAELWNEGGKTAVTAAGIYSTKR